MDAETKVRRAAENNRLKLIGGQRYWYNYFLSITELTWARNLDDGYLIDVYEEEYGKHLARLYISNYV